MCVLIRMCARACVCAHTHTQREWECGCEWEWGHVILTVISVRTTCCQRQKNIARHGKLAQQVFHSLPLGIPTAYDHRPYLLEHRISQNSLTWECMKQLRICSTNVKCKFTHKVSGINTGYLTVLHGFTQRWLTIINILIMSFIIFSCSFYQ